MAVMHKHVKAELIDTLDRHIHLLYNLIAIAKDDDPSLEAMAVEADAYLDAIDAINAIPVDEST